LIGKQSCELTRFGIGERQGAVDGDDVAVFVPIPKVAIAGDDSAAALKFQEEDAGLSDGESIDLVYGTVVADEFEIRVDEDRVTIGQGLADEIESLTLVRVTRFGELFPTAGR
jgi:hypothetical protein